MATETVWNTLPISFSKLQISVASHHSQSHNVYAVSMDTIDYLNKYFIASNSALKNVSCFIAIGY